MSYASTQELKRYLKPGAIIYLFYALGAMMAFLFVACLSSGLDPLEPSSLLLVVLTIALFLSGYWPQRKLSKQITAMEQAGEMSQILQEFAQSQSLVDGNIRLSQNYVFGRHSGVILRYGDIRQVYIHVSRFMFFEMRRDLMFVGTSSKKAAPLCKLKYGDRSKEDVAKIMGYIQHRNPAVKLGY